MASKKKSVTKKSDVSEIRFVVLPNGEEHEIVREDGKFYYTESSQFRRVSHTVKTVIAEQPKPIEEEPAKEETAEKEAE